MHELAVTENILNIAVKHATQANATCVTDIHIVIGRLSSIVDDSIQFYWDMISENTICAQSKLHFQRLPARILCLDCAHEFEIESFLAPCPSCNSARVKVLSGEEFWLESIEIQKV
jgi:hydrogenase nickel incorporation protein HypA/HybF